MDNTTPKKLKAGMTLKRLIKQYYPSQEEFAATYGADIRTVSRYVNNGIDSVDTIQQLAMHFQIPFEDFFK